MNVLLSVKPQFAELIFSGAKRYEYRRVIFGRSDIKIIVLYATSPLKKIVGEFVIDEIIHDTPESLWTKTSTFAGVEQDYFFNYFLGKEKAFAIGIKDARKYPTPLDPQEMLLNFTPPQSFMYLASRKLPSQR